MLTTIRYHLFFIFILISSFFYAQEKNIKVEKHSTNTPEKDSLNPKSSNALEKIITYTSDRQIHDLINRITYLKGNAKVNYETYEIQANYIEINWKTNAVNAKGKKNTNGKILEPAIFKENEKNYEYNELNFNFKSRLGTAYNSRIVEGENVIVSKIAKRKNDSISFLKNSIYTTDTYFLNKKDSLADYHIAISKIKNINNKQIITGPVQFYIEQVPTPLVLPFLTIPLTNDRRAGLLMPVFGETENTGFYLQGLGLYIPIKDYADIKLTGDFYSKGSFGFHNTNTYKKIYSYDGDLRFDFENNITGVKGLDNYNKSSLFNFSWNHIQDAKLNPFLVFSSNVNFSSTNYFSGTINNNNIVNQRIFTNTTSSSINLIKKFNVFPGTISLGLNHSQNNESKLVDLVLPQLNFNIPRQYLFAGKNQIKKGLLQKIGMDYELDSRNEISTKDSLIFKKEMFENLKTGINQTINLNTGTTLLSYFPVNFNFNYKETTYFNEVKKTFNSISNTVDEEKINGLNSFRTFSGGGNISTTFYGMLKFKKGKISAIRHMVIPQIGFSYSPNFSTNFWGYYKSYLDNSGKSISYSKYDGIYGSPNATDSKLISFSLDNSLEMKVFSKNDSIDEGTTKKIKILERLNINASYDAALENKNLSNITFNGTTSILKEKLNINFNGTVNPYEYNKTSKVFLDNLGKLKLVNYDITASINFNPDFFTKEKKEKTPKYNKTGTVVLEKYFFDDENYAKFPVKWDLNLGLSHNVQFNESEDKYNNLSSMRFSGSISPSLNWLINFSSGYDFNSNEITFTSLGFKRDLRSFEIAFNWVPIGANNTWDFLINIKATILKDALKYNERSLNTNNNF
ncbi:MAG: putative LPS assembly protein LptD [Solirubrobacteraceae bacterium]